VDRNTGAGHPSEPRLQPTVPLAGTQPQTGQLSRPHSVWAVAEPLPRLHRFGHKEAPSARFYPLKCSICRTFADARMDTSASVLVSNSLMPVKNCARPSRAPTPGAQEPSRSSVVATASDSTESPTSLLCVPDLGAERTQGQEASERVLGKTSEVNLQNKSRLRRNTWKMTRFVIAGASRAHRS
jgi:hypothetical protein